MRCRWLSLLLASLLMFVSQNGFSQSTTVESQGVAAIVQGNLDISRDNAVQDALRNAVEQATGSLIENQTLVENYQLLSDKIYSQSKGYVHSYEIISEGTDQGLFRVTVRATVRDGDLKNDLEALNVLMRQVRKPRVMVLFEDFSNSGLDSGRMAEGHISKILLDKGFKLVDADAVRRNIGRDKVMGLLAGEEKVATAIGAKYGAEILLVGSAQAVSEKVTIGELVINSNQAVLSAKLIRADTGEVKVSETAQAAKPHVNKLTGMQLAMSEASELLANALVDRIASIFQQQVYNITSFKLIVNGLKDYNQLQEVIQFMSANVRGVKEMYQRNYTMGTAELEVELTGSAQSLATDLTSRKRGPYEFTINEITHNQLQVTVTSTDR